MADRRGANLDAVVGGFARDPLLEDFVAPFTDLLAERDSEGWLRELASRWVRYAGPL